MQHSNSSESNAIHSPQRFNVVKVLLRCNASANALAPAAPTWFAKSAENIAFFEISSNNLSQIDLQNKKAHATLQFFRIKCNSLTPKIQCRQGVTVLQCICQCFCTSITDLVC